MKKRNSFLIGVLIGILISVLIIIILFFTNKISFSVKEKESIKEDKEMVELMETDAIEILKPKLDVAVEFLESSNTYCGPNGFTQTNDILTDNSEPYTYYLINDFNTFADLENYLLKFMTKDVLSINEYYLQDNYLEQDNKLYCKGLNKSNTEATYENIEINNISSNEITATVTVIESGLGDSISNKMKIKLTKTNDIWKISLYEKSENE